MFEGDKLIAKVFLSWKKHLEIVLIEKTFRNCANCKKIYFM